MATFGFNRTFGHTAEATLDVLQPVSEDRIISRRAISELRFETVGLLFVGCRQAGDN